MKKSILTICLTFTFCYLNAQNIQPNVDVNLLMSHTGEKFTLTIKSQKNSLNNCKLQIIDSKGMTIKTIEFPEKSKYWENIVPIHDLAIGKYLYIVACNKYVLCKGEFTKDIYDEL